MGFAPRQVNEMSLFEFECAFNGWRKANSPEEAPPAMSDDTLAELGIVGFD